MAKRSNAQANAIKRRDNRTSNKPLFCHTKDCEEDFYVTVNKVRYCEPHAPFTHKAPQVSKRKTNSLLYRLRMIH